MIITVVNKDCKINVFTDQKSEQLEDVLNAVSSGCGFVLNGPRGIVAYGPGTVARVGFTEEKEKRNG